MIWIFNLTWFTFKNFGKIYTISIRFFTGRIQIFSVRYTNIKNEFAEKNKLQRYQVKIKMCKIFAKIDGILKAEY